MHPVIGGEIADTFLLSSSGRNFWELRDFPGSSVGKESTYKRFGLIPGLGSPLGEGTGYPLQYSWASLVVHMVNNMQAMWETWVRSLSWEDPLEEGMAPHSIFLPGESPGTEEPGRLQPMGSHRVRHD